jgi:signal recognition particle subunit SEC65
LNNANESNLADLIQRLSNLEYAIRQSMTVREDQDEAANPHHTHEAESYGISVEVNVTKGDLLNAVQTLVRATQKKTRLS